MGVTGDLMADFEGPRQQRYRFRLAAGRNRWRWLGRVLTTYMVSQYTLRTPLYRGDIEMAMIGDVIAMEALGVGHGTTGKPPGSGCSLASIVQASGLPRETVRRKVLMLAEQGYATSADGKHYRLQPEILRTEPYWEAIQRQNELSLQFGRGMVDGLHVVVEVTGEVPAVLPPHMARIACGDLEDCWRDLMRALTVFYLKVNRLRAPYHGDDLEAVVLFDLVGILSVDHFADDPRFQESLLDLDIVLGKMQRGSTVQRLAQIIGLPRETVRRKLKLLIDGGSVERVDEGYIHRPGFLQSAPVREVMVQIEVYILDFMNQCLDTGVFSIAIEPTSAGDH